VEADAPASGTSRLSWGWVNASGKEEPAYFDFNHAGVRAHQGAPWFVRAGQLTWADADGHAAKAEREAARGYEVEIVPRAAAAALEPALAIPDDVRDVAFYPAEGYVDGTAMVAELLGRARARVVTHDRVVGIAHGAVRLASGTTVEADEVVVCAGRWTDELLGTRLLCDGLPDAPGRGLVVTTSPVAGVPRRVVHAPDVSFRPAGDRLVLAARDTDDRLAGEPVPALAAELLARARAVVPALAGASVERAEVCVRALPRDGRPVVGRVEDAYVVVTHSGMTLASHVAELVASELVTGCDRPELAPYRPARLVGGTLGA
jgi:glycine/D-amino acid oxidase-like deaminating enzyme